MTKKEIFHTHTEIQNSEIISGLDQFKESIFRHGFHIEQSVFTTKETQLAQILGMWTIPPKTLDEYRVDNPSERTYRGGQG